MYFIQKAAIYSHGVFCIGENLNEAKKECDRLALEDLDAHHSYAVYEFGILNNDKMPSKGDKGYFSDFDHDPEHRKIYSVDKNNLTVNNRYICNVHEKKGGMICVWSR